MTTDATTCRRFEDDLAALALGTLTGRARAEAIAHVESCHSCERTLRQLSSAADRLLELAPSAEPPPGFEDRVLYELGRSRRGRFAVPRRRLAVLAAAAVIVALLGFLVGDVVGTGSPSPTTSAAAFVSHGHSVGELSVRAGNPARLTVKISGLGHDGPIVCKVTDDRGRVITVGIFWLYDGAGSWAVALPFPANDLRSATITTESGGPLAAAKVS